MKIDLHTHTNFSACADRENSYEKLLIKAQESGITKLAITDHNTCLFHVINLFTDTSKYFKGEIVAGMECDAIEEGMAFEVLAYNFDVMKLFNWAFKTYGTLESRQYKIRDILVEKVKKSGYKIDETRPFNGKVEYAHNYIYQSMIDFPENQKLFKDFGIERMGQFYRVNTTDKSFPLYLDLGSLFPNLKQVVEAIHDAGGVAILAHPYNYAKELDPEKLLKYVLEFGLDGVEVYHPSCSEDQREYLLNFAKKNNLLVSGGSDYHGTEHHSYVGIDNYYAGEPKINI